MVLELQTRLRELIEKAGVTSALKNSSSESSMDFHGGRNDDMTGFVGTHDMYVLRVLGVLCVDSALNRPARQKKRIAPKQPVRRMNRAP